MKKGGKAEGEGRTAIIFAWREGGMGALPALSLFERRPLRVFLGDAPGWP